MLASDAMVILKLSVHSSDYGADVNVLAKDL